MEQVQNQKVPKQINLAIDIGTTTTKVAVSEIADPANPAAAVDYLLEFPSSEPTHVKSTHELDTTLVFNECTQKFSFGSDGITYSKCQVLRDWKLGVMGVEPYAESLMAFCRHMQQCLGHFTPASVFRKLFEYILETAKEHLRTKYGDTFGTIKAWLTYPVSGGPSIQVLLLQEAIAAGLDVMGSSSESRSAAYLLETKEYLGLPGGAKLILDIGGATMDATVLYKNDEGQLIQACATDGHPFGGQMINESIRSWLRANFTDWESLSDDNAWAALVLPSIDRCKRAFDGQTDLVIFREGGLHVTIPSFVPIYDIPRLDTEQKLIAALAAYPGTVARGALHCARSPLDEEYVITPDMGLTYDGDYTINGEPLNRGEWWRGIGWILRKGQNPKTRPGYVKFTKKIQPGSKDPGDLIIQSELHVTPPDSGKFSKEHIKRNDLIQWDCDITYPATEQIFTFLSHLGTFSGKIPHKKLFPLGNETEEQEFEFELTLDNDRQLLRAVFTVVLQNGERCFLDKVYYTPLPVVPRSEYKNQLNPGVKRRAGDNSVDDRSATRTLELPLPRMAIPRSKNAVGHSPSSPEPGSPEPGSPDPGSLEPGSPDPGNSEPGSSEPDSPEPGSPDHPPNLPDDLPLVRGPSRLSPVTANAPLRRRLRNTPVIHYPPGFRPPQRALRRFANWPRPRRGPHANIVV